MRRKRGTVKRPPKEQLSFSLLAPDAGWARNRPPVPPNKGPGVTPSVAQELLEFERAAVDQGLVQPNSARTYRKALRCVAQQAERHLGRPLKHLYELYEAELITALARDDEPFDQSTPQLSRYTMRQRRTVLIAYLRAVGVPHLRFEEAYSLVKKGFRRASTRRGDRYIIGAGRPERRDLYRPPLEDVKTFLTVAPAAFNAYLGHCLAAAAALTLFHGLRPFSILSIDGTDFTWHRDSLRLEYVTKAVKGMRRRRKIELSSQAIKILLRYVEAFNAYARWHGSSERIGLELPGAFFRSLRGDRLLYGDLLRAYAECSHQVNIRPFTSYGLRRVYASGLACILPVDEAAIAGGWANEAVYLRHYVRSMRDWQAPLLLDAPPIDFDEDMPTATKTLPVGESVT